MKTAIFTLLLLLCPFTLKAQDTLKTPRLIVTLDSASLARLQAIIDSTVGARMALVGHWQWRTDTLYETHFDKSLGLFVEYRVIKSDSVWLPGAGK